MNLAFQLENIDKYGKEQEKESRKKRRAKRAKIREKLAENHIDATWHSEMREIYDDFWGIFED